jgi:hypothetical protein
MVQVSHNAFVCDISGVDIGFIFKIKDSPVEVRVQQVPVSEQPDIKEPEFIPEPVLVTVKPATPSYFSGFIDVEDVTHMISEAERQILFQMDARVFKGKRVDEKTGKEFPVLLDRTSTNHNLNHHTEEFAVWQKLVGYPYTYYFMEVHSEGDYTYTAIIDYVAMGYQPFPLYLIQQREEKTTWEEFEPIAKMLTQKILNACMIFGKNYVMHSIAGELFVIHPQSRKSLAQLCNSLLTMLVLNS